MQEYTNEQILTAFKMLPDDVKEAMFSVDTAKIIQETGNKYKLMVDKIGGLADETNLVMLGFTHPNQFIDNLAEGLDVDKTIARQIAEDINSRIFFPIRENLKKIHQIEEGTPVEEPRPGFGEPEPGPVSVFAAPELPIGADLTEPPKAAEEMPAMETPKEETPPSPPDIFGEKTKEEVFRSPIQVSEKNLGIFEKPSSPPPPPPPPKPDPYREPII